LNLEQLERHIFVSNQVKLYFLQQIKQLSPLLHFKVTMRIFKDSKLLKEHDPIHHHRHLHQN
jgi:hypothetical protein